MLEIFLYRSEIRFFGPTLQHLKKKIPFPIENYTNPLENWHFEGSSNKESDEPGIPGFTLNCNLPSEFFVSLTKFLHIL